jgi:aminoglycoside phosphotransferase
MKYQYLIEKLQNGQDYDYQSGDASDMSYVMQEAADAIEELEEESKRLDWFEKNNHLILHLGTNWYVRSAYGQPWIKKTSLREAIDHGISILDK